MTCSDCAPLASRYEAAQRQLDRLHLDVAERDKELAGIAATIARQREERVAAAWQRSRSEPGGIR